VRLGEAGDDGVINGRGKRAARWGVGEVGARRLLLWERRGRFDGGGGGMFGPPVVRDDGPRGVVKAGEVAERADLAVPVGLAVVVGDGA